MPLIEIMCMGTYIAFEVQASADVGKTQGKVYPNSIQNAKQNEQCLTTDIRV